MQPQTRKPGCPGAVSRLPVDRPEGRKDPAQRVCQAERPAPVYLDPRESGLFPPKASAWTRDLTSRQGPRTLPNPDRRDARRPGTQAGSTFRCCLCSVLCDCKIPPTSRNGEKLDAVHPASGDRVTRHKTLPKARALTRKPSRGSLRGAGACAAASRTRSVAGHC